MRTVALIGAAGQLGCELARELQAIGPVIPVGTETIDFTSPRNVGPQLDRLGPSLVVNAAAYTAVDRAEDEPDLAHTVNAKGPEALARWCEINGVPLVHYSTDYVFDGSSERPYVETDVPRPLNVYGESKLAGERAVLEGCSRAIVLRTAWLYSWLGRNFFLTMMRLARETATLRVVDDQVGAPTWARDLARATSGILSSPDSVTPETAGVYHLTAGGETSWFGFARRIVEWDPRSEEHVCTEVVPIASSERVTPAVRPRRSVLDCTRVEKVFGVAIRSWEEQLREALLQSGPPRAPGGS